MKTTVIFLVFTAGCLTAVAQITPTIHTASVTIPHHIDIDPARFRLYDVNKDGKLDLQEQAAERASRPAWEAAMRARVQKARQEHESRQRQFDLERFDANKDGVLDATEQKARDQHYATLRQEFIKKHDQNGNGKIDPEEMRPVVPVKPTP